MITEIIPLTRLPRGVPETYSYIASEELKPVLVPGMIVSIEFRNKQINGIVKSIKKTEVLENNKVIKQISHTLFPYPLVTPQQIKLARFISHTNLTSLASAAKLCAPEIPKRIKSDELGIKNKTVNHKSKTLNPELLDPIHDQKKLETLIKNTINAGKQVLFLVPERTDIKTKYDNFSEILNLKSDILNWNQSTSKKKNLEEYLSVLNHKSKLIIGARSALFAPFSNLGLIVMENEQDDSYKSDQSPRYHARDVAQELAKIHGTQLVYYTSSSSLEIYNELKSTPTTNSLQPTTYVVDLKQERLKGNFHVLSEQLQYSITNVLEQDKNIFLFHNRRGHASVISCEDCGHIINCPECDLPLVLHGTSRLTCHHCRYKTDLPPLCPACAQPNIKLSGKGTQRVEQEIKKMFPHANIIRLDSDSPASKKIHPHATIIIGTEYALSRLDWNSISLIGIINADQALYRPDFRASERTYQLLKRLQLKSEILNLKSFFIQTYNPQNTIFESLINNDPNIFYSQELNLRKTLGYPPYKTIIKCIFKHKDDKTAAGEAMHIYHRLRKHLLNDPEFEPTHASGIDIIKPYPSQIKKTSGKFQFNLILKVPHPIKEAVCLRLKELVPPGWVFDTDPETLL